MIIEIKDLPQGQKIKKILIEFDSESSEVSDSKSSDSTVLVTESVNSTKTNKSADITKNKGGIEIPEIPDSVPLIEVPEEMTELEF